MMDIQITAFDQRYLPEVIALWNEVLIHDPIKSQRFIDMILLDENFDASLAKIALQGEQVIGFVLGIKRKFPYLERGLEETRGWINIMLVHPSCQRRGIGTRLLVDVEQEFRQLGVREITLCAYSPNYFFPGIDVRYPQAIAFFEKHGYIFQSDAVSMQRDLWDYTMPQHTLTKLQELQTEGIHIVSYSFPYMDRLLRFVEREFDAGWKRNILVAMQKQEAEKTILLAVDQQDQILGYCMRKIDCNDARFGPIGVSAALRSKGLGGVLLDVMMMEMKKNQIYYLYFLWTHGAAQRFYERHGLSVYRTYRLYRKVLIV